MTTKAIKTYVISMYDLLQMSAEEIADTAGLLLSEVQEVIAEHQRAVDQWLLSAEPMVVMPDVGCEFD